MINPTGETEERCMWSWVTEQLCARLLAWKGSFLAIISRGGKGPIKLCDAGSSVIASCLPRSSPPPLTSSSASFTARWHHQPPLVGSVRTAPGGKSFCAHRTLNSRCSGHWRLANVESRRLPSFSRRMDHETRVDSIPKGLKLKKKSNHWITAFKMVMLLLFISWLWVGCWRNHLVSDSKVIKRQSFSGLRNDCLAQAEQRRNHGKGKSLTSHVVKMILYQFGKGWGWGLEDPP